MVHENLQSLQNLPVVLIWGNELVLLSTMGVSWRCARSPSTLLSSQYTIWFIRLINESGCVAHGHCWWAIHKCPGVNTGVQQIGNCGNRISSCFQDFQPCHNWVNWFINWVHVSCGKVCSDANLRLYANIRSKAALCPACATAAEFSRTSQGSCGTLIAWPKQNGSAILLSWLPAAQNFYTPGLLLVSLQISQQKHSN